MTNKEEQKDWERLRNYYLTFLAIVLTIFCLFHINLIYVVTQKEVAINPADVSLIALVLIINLGLTGNLKSFSLGKSGLEVEFAEVKSDVKQLQKDIEQLKDQLMTAAILDGYEFCTLTRLNEQENSPSPDEEFKYNFHADLQLRHLYNIGFIKMKTEGEGYDAIKGEVDDAIKQSNEFKKWLEDLDISNYYDRERKFELEKYFILTERGQKYLEIHAQSDLKTPVIDEHNQLFFLNSKQYNIYDSLTKANLSISKQKAIEIATKNNNSN